MSNSLAQPSYKQSFARSAGESAYPKWWQGLQFAPIPALGPTGATLFDVGGKHIHGTLTEMDPATDWIVGRPGWGLDLDGSNDWIDFGDNVNLGTSDFTAAVLVAAKADLSTADAGGRAIQKRGAGGLGTLSGWNLSIKRVGSNVHIAQCFFDDDSNAAGDFGLAVDTGFDVGELFFLSIERENLTTVRCRVNGRSLYSDTNVLVTGSVDNVRKLTIGASDVPATQYTSIKVYGAWIWNYALGDALVEFSADPFAMFRLRRRITYSVPVTPGGIVVLRRRIEAA